MLSTQTAIAQMQQDAYTDLANLHNIKQVGREDKQQALKQLSKQFESLFLHMMLKGMRTANEVFEKDNVLNSFEVKMHRDMLDHQLALSVSKSSTLGLAEALYRQMARRDGVDKLDVANNNVANNNVASTKVANTKVDSSHTKNINLAAIAPATASNDQHVRRILLGEKRPIADSPHGFIREIYPYAQEAADRLGVNAKVLVAQAALETGWGQYVIHDRLGKNGFNLFNIKAGRGWRGDGIRIATVEYKQGLAVRERADFRRYDNLQQGFNDYVTLLTSNSRYQPALSAAQNPPAFLRELHKAGYATDPEYADKILAIVDSDHLR